MKKTAAEQMPGLLKESAELVQKLASSNEELLDRNAQLEKELRLIKIAHRMDERGLEPTLSPTEKVAALAELDEQKLLGIEAACELSGPGFTLGTLKSEAGGETRKVATAEDLDNFILSNEAFS